MSVFRKVLRVNYGFLVTICALVLAISSLIVVRAPALAQTPAPNLLITSATLQVWPEYDTKDTLVIVSGVVTTTAAFPVQITFPVPANATGVHATTDQGGGSLIEQQAQRNGDQLTYALGGPAFHLEYYVPLPLQGSQRNIAFSWRAPYDVKSLDIDVQQPARSSGFTLTPQGTASAPDTENLIHHLITQSDVKAGTAVNLNISYSKTDQLPSVSRPVAQPTTAASAPSASAPAAASAPGGLVALLPFILVGVGAALLAGAAIYWFMFMRQGPAQGPRQAQAGPAPARQSGRAGAQQPAARSGAAPGGSRAAFCPKCGRPFGPDDRFCGNCGTPRDR